MGDNVAVKAPREDEPYWLMIVVAVTYTIEEAFTNLGKNLNVLGDVVFSGLWYERLKEGSCTYLLRMTRRHVQSTII